MRHSELTSAVSLARAMSSEVGVWKALESRERNQFMGEERTRAIWRKARSLASFFSPHLASSCHLHLSPDSDQKSRQPTLRLSRAELCCSPRARLRKQMTKRRGFL